VKIEDSATCENKQICQENILQALVVKFIAVDQNVQKIKMAL
jgi:hypothetical protein